jgi:two-component system sensor histidine kinase VicK
LTTTTAFLITAIAFLALALGIGLLYFHRRLRACEANRKSVNADFEAAEYRLRLLESAVRQIGDGVIILAENGGFVLINEGAKMLLGLDDSDIAGQIYDEVVAGFSEKLETNAILEAAAEGHSGETVNVEGRDYRLGFAAIGDEDGNSRGAVCVISDVTESMKAESMQTDFVANVSHELKTPLTAVKSYAETLLKGDLSDEAMTRDFLGVIDSEADRMDRLVRDLLIMTRIDGGAISREMVESDLPTLVRTAMKKLSMEAKEKALTVNRMFAENLVFSTYMDRDRMEQVVLNILSNAIKYTDEKGRIDVDIIPNENCVQIVISDNGIGIPEKAQARVFERFFRVDKARSRQMGGSGLGLAISRQIVDAHGGEIEIESKFGKGTKVTVTLPISGRRGKRGIL